MASGNGQCVCQSSALAAKVLSKRGGEGTALQEVGWSAWASDDMSDVFGVSASEVLDSGAVRKRKSQISPFLLGGGGADDEFDFSLATASSVHAPVVNMAGAETSSLGRMAGPSASTSPKAAASASVSVSHDSRRHLASPACVLAGVVHVRRC